MHVDHARTRDRHRPVFPALGGLVLLAALTTGINPAPSDGAIPATTTGPRAGVVTATQVRQPATAEDASATVVPSAVRPGRRVAASGTGFGPGETVRVELATAAGASTRAVTIADPSGRVRAVFRVPPLTPAGSWPVSLVGSATGRTATTTLLIRTNWAQFGRGRGHHADNPYERLVNPATVGSLAVAWRTSTVTACTSYSSPAVVQRRVYVGDYCGAVTALDATTGAQLWTTPTDGKVDATPAVVGGRVIVATGVPGHSVYALSRTNGHVLWRVEMASGVLASPVVRNGVAYQASTDGWVYAIDAATGTLVWKSLVGKGDADLASTPVVGDDALYAGSDDGHLYALSLRDGTPLWVGDVGTQVRLGSPALSQHHVLVGSGVGLFAFPDDGCGPGVTECAPVWRSESEHALSGTLAVAGGLVYTVQEDDVVLAYRTGCQRATCGVVMSAQLEGDHVSGGLPSVAGRVLYVTSSFPNAVTAFDARTGRELWTYSEDTADYPGNPTVTVVDQTVFATFTWSRAFLAFRLR